MSDKLDLILKELQTLNSRVSNIESNMATKEDVADLPLIKRAVLDTSEAIIRLEQAQERQHRVIDLLSARSIEHEAELRRKQQ